MCDHTKDCRDCFNNQAFVEDLSKMSYDTDSFNRIFAVTYPQFKHPVCKACLKLEPEDLLECDWCGCNHCTCDNFVCKVCKVKYCCICIAERPTLIRQYDCVACGTACCSNASTFCKICKEITCVAEDCHCSCPDD